MPLKSFISHDIQGAVCPLGLLGGHALRVVREHRRWKTGQVSRGARVRLHSPSHFLAERTLQREVPSPTCHSCMAKGAWPDSPAQMHWQLHLRGAARGTQRSPCPLWLIADHALKMQSRICSLQCEYRGTYVACNDGLWCERRKCLFCLWARGTAVSREPEVWFLMPRKSSGCQPSPSSEVPRNRSRYFSGNAKLHKQP